MAPRDKNTDTTFDNGPTTSTSAEDASTTEGQAAAGTAPDPQRVILEQPAPEPAVFYGDGGLVPGAGAATDPDKPHVHAQYEPFSW